MKKYSYLDLFSGCGGLSFGFSKQPSFDCLLACDVWDKAGENYKLNHSDTPFEIKDFSIKEDQNALVSRFKGKCDLVIGGPPCQGFSTLGKRKVDCSKSILVDVFLEMATKIKPKIILMENVKTITSKKHPSGGLVTNKIDEILSRSNYVYKTIVLSALDFGLGQTRSRFFLFAVEEENYHILDQLLSEINARKINTYSNLKDLIGDLPSIEARQGSQVINEDDRVIYNHQAMNHSDTLVERFSHVPPGGGLINVPKDLLTPHLTKMVSGEYGNGGHVKNIYGRMEWDKPSGTIVAGMDKITVGRFLHPINNRLLTPRECARIQSFPDNFIFKGSLVTQYYLIGNAVPPIFSSVISESIKITLEENKWS